MGGNRFWEFYLVRYLLGTIFGVVVLFFLVINYNNQITASFFKSEIAIKVEKFEQEDKLKAEKLLNEGDVLGVVKMLGDDDKVRANLFSFLFSTTYDVNKDDAIDILKVLGKSDLFTSTHSDKMIQLKQTGFPILAAIVIVISGFLYMYLSSMLILVLHGVRSVLFSFPKNPESRKYPFVFCWIFTLLALFFFCIFFIADNHIGKHISSVSILILIFAIIVVGSTEFKSFYTKISLFRVFNKDKRVVPNLVEKTIITRGFQRKTTSKLDSQGEEEIESQLSRKEYVESYRHLREHGNAFGIIVCELFFLIWLIKWEFSAWAIFYWCALGFTMWFLGTFLETSVVNHEGDTTS